MSASDKKMTKEQTTKEQKIKRGRHYIESNKTKHFFDKNVKILDKLTYRPTSS